VIQRAPPYMTFEKTARLLSDALKSHGLDEDLLGLMVWDLVVGPKYPITANEIAEIFYNDSDLLKNLRERFQEIVLRASAFQAVVAAMNEGKMPPGIAQDAIERIRTGGEATSLSTLNSDEERRITRWQCEMVVESQLFFPAGRLLQCPYPEDFPPWVFEQLLDIADKVERVITVAFDIHGNLFNLLLQDISRNRPAPLTSQSLHLIMDQYVEILTRFRRPQLEDD